jgi:hypothetical protein
LVVTANVPPEALAHTTRALTGLTAKNRWVVPLCCSVRVGPWGEGSDFRLVAPGESEKVPDDGAAASEQAREMPAARPVTMVTIEKGRSMVGLQRWGASEVFVELPLLGRVRKTRSSRPLYQAQAAVHAGQIALRRIRSGIERLVRPALLDCPAIQPGRPTDGASRPTALAGGSAGPHRQAGGDYL